jgi:hypothetical protein
MKYFRMIYLVILLSYSGCIFEPDGPDYKDPRTYTWTTDTLAYPGSMQTNMQSIWASSPNNIYIVGHNDSGGGMVWHYDGDKWTVVRVTVVEGGPIEGVISLQDIFGMDPGNIWVVGSRVGPERDPPRSQYTIVIHFDGNEWREQEIDTIESRLQIISGTSPDNLWAAGWYESLYHFDGQSWKKHSVPLEIPYEHPMFFTFTAMAVLPTNEVLLTGYKHDNDSAKTTYYLFRYQSDTWTLADSSSVYPGGGDFKWGHTDFWVSPSGTLYSCGGRGVYRWNNSGWEKILEHPVFLTGINGTSDDNFFVVGHRGVVLHWNGNDWHPYQQFGDHYLVLQDVWTDGKEVFIVGITLESYPQETVILHGK